MTQREIVQLWDALDELHDAYLRYRERTGRTAHIQAEHVPFLETRMRTFDVYMAVGHISNFEYYTGLKPLEFENIFERLAEPLLHSATHASPISGRQRLFIFMRFATHGYSFGALAKEIHSGKSTVAAVVYEVADAISEVFFAEAFPPFTRADLEEVALKTQQRFDYPRAAGFMDGKHINIKRPAHSATHYYNYKKNYSIILLALVDCDYRVLAFDLGAPGRVGDAGVYRKSNIKRFLDAKDEIFPPTRTLGNVGPVQYHILVDRGFGQDYRFVRPYSQASADTPSKRRFNQKHSGARRMVESTFGILCRRFGILQRTLQVEPANAIKIVTSLLVLHNLLARREHALEFVERYPIPPQELVKLQDENPQSPRRGAQAASTAREKMTAHYDNLYGSHQ